MASHHLYGDLTNIATLLDLFSQYSFDGIIHIAGSVSFREWEKERIFQVNVEGTKNLVNLALECGVARFIMVSSSAALGRHQVQDITEEQQWTPHPLNTYYAWTKYLATKEVWRGQEEGLKVTIFYPTVILGYHPRYQSSAALFRIARRKHLWVPSGQNGFVSARDVAKAIEIALFNEDTIGQDFILNEGNYSWRTLFQWIREAYGIHVPLDLLPDAYRPIAVIHRYLSRLLQTDLFLPPYEVYQTMSLKLSYSSMKWQKCVNFVFEPIQDTIVSIVQTYGANQDLFE
jgi:nucleoside-diphosphate-sugar epimerase